MNKKCESQICLPLLNLCCILHVIVINSLNSSFGKIHLFYVAAHSLMNLPRQS